MKIILKNRCITDDEIVNFVKFRKNVKKFTFWFHFVNLHSISFGIHFDVKNLVVEFHIPFGFLHVGLENIIIDLDDRRAKNKASKSGPYG